MYICTCLDDGLWGFPLFALDIYVFITDCRRPVAESGSVHWGSQHKKGVIWGMRLQY